MKLQLKCLTPEQEARMPEWRDKWIKIGLSTERMELDRFTKAVNDCYRFAKRAAPKAVIAVPDPLMLVLAAPMAAAIIAGNRLAGGKRERAVSVHDVVDSVVRGAVQSAMRYAVSDVVDHTLGTALNGVVDSAVGSAVRDVVDQAVGSAVDSAVGSAVRDVVDRAVGSAMRDALIGIVDQAVGTSLSGSLYLSMIQPVRGAMRRVVDSAVSIVVYQTVGNAVGIAVDQAVDTFVWDAVQNEVILKTIQSCAFARMGGQFWVGGWWGSPALTSFFREVCGVRLPGKLDACARAYQETCETACWWWPHTDFVMVADRPAFIHRDAGGRLHHESGQAIGWLSGFGVWSWHGTWVPKEMIEQPIDPRQIGNFKNAEHNRVALERYGIQRFVTEYATIIDDTHPHGQLAEVEFNGRRQRYIIGINGSKGLDGTRAKYVLLADNNAKTYQEAAALSYPTLTGKPRTAEQYHLSHGRT